jgi:Acetyl esterase (deacetylase)
MSELVVFVKKEWKYLYVNEIVASTIKCVNYISSVKDLNKDKIFVQGSGVAGAYAFVACSASEKLKAGIIENPIFDNFLNQFSIDTFAEKLNAPILLGFGLQNNVVDLQKIFSVYNNVKVKKEYYGFPTSKNILPDEWKIIKKNFLEKF